MEGEDPQTDEAADARHWQEVYRRLVDFTVRRIAQQPHNLAVLDGRLDRYGVRLNFWRERAWQLDCIAIDEPARTISHWSFTVRLTRREFQILMLLLDHPGRCFTARALLLEAWHDSALPEEAIRTYITRLRRKLDPMEIAAIVTVPREGYRLELESAGSTPGFAMHAGVM